MGLFNVFDISSAGMSVEQSRLAVSAANLANARTTRSDDGSAYQPLAVVVRTALGRNVGFGELTERIETDALPRPVVADVVPMQVEPRVVYEPGHPDADERGFVRYPGVDSLGSMLDLMSISRSYEANLRAFDITRHLIQRTIDLGRGR